MEPVTFEIVWPHRPDIANLGRGSASVGNDGYVSIITDYLQGGVLGDEGTGRGVTGRLDAGAACA